MPRLAALYFDLRMRVRDLSTSFTYLMAISVLLVIYFSLEAKDAAQEKAPRKFSGIYAQLMCAARCAAAPPRFFARQQGEVFFAMPFLCLLASISRRGYSLGRRAAFGRQSTSTGSRRRLPCPLTNFAGGAGFGPPPPWPDVENQLGTLLVLAGFAAAVRRNGVSRTRFWRVGHVDGAVNFFLRRRPSYQPPRISGRYNYTSPSAAQRKSPTNTFYFINSANWRSPLDNASRCGDGCLPSAHAQRNFT